MSSSDKRGWKRAVRRALIAAAVGGVGLVAMGIGGLVYLSLDLPSITSLNEYNPPQSTRIYSDDGQLVGELFKERRRVAPIDAIPQHVVYAFLAAEDATFYQHQGLDYWGILRAAIKNLRPGAHLQGASTITQQTVKTMVVGAERSYVRKMREALLTRELEQMLDKDEILYLYLNQIYFGTGAYGVEEAARVYFGKSVRDLSLAEGAYLAAAPKNPSHYTLRADPVAAKERQRYVLNRMLENGWAEEKQVREAIAAPPPMPAPPPPYLRRTPHYVEQVRRLLLERYTEEQVLTGGLTVYTGMNAMMQVAGQEALRKGLEELAMKHGYPGAKLRIEVDRFVAYHKALEEAFAAGLARIAATDARNDTRWMWDLAYVGARSLAERKSVQSAMEIVPFADDARVTGLVVAVDSVGKDTFIDLGSLYARVTMKNLAWARRFSPRGATQPPRNPTEVFRRGDLVPLDLLGAPQGKYRGKPIVEAMLVARPMVEGALVAIDPYTRHVRAMVGGYDLSSGGLIRAVQSHRQPGSAFKPILYSTALTEKVITPASICPDSPVVIRDPWTGKSWKPENHDGRYDGNITYRRALTKSKNTCSVKLIDKIGYEPVIAQAKAMGIHSELPENLTLALGTADVTPMELTNAYATIAAGGLYAEPIFIRKVVDAKGVILEETNAVPEQAMDPAAAYVVTQMMRSVIEEGTATRALVLDRVVVGKTGTSQESRNVWFAGFSPELVAAVWVGFDNNEPLGRAYGGTVALPIWIRFMGRALTGVPAREFTRPENVVSLRVNRVTGQLTDSTDDANSIEEVFIAGTEPNEKTQPLLNPFLIDEDQDDDPRGPRVSHRD